MTTIEISTAIVNSEHSILYPRIFVKASASLPVIFRANLMLKKNNRKITTKANNTRITLHPLNKLNPTEYYQKDSTLRDIEIKKHHSSYTAFLAHGSR